MTPRDRLTPNERLVLAVGAYVLQAQELEHLLKFLLPMTDETNPSLTAVIGRNAILSKKSLGVVAREFVKAGSGDVADLQKLFAEIVSERNEIVHHFSARFAPLVSSNQYEEILKELKVRHRRATDLIQALRPVTLAVMEMLRDGPYAGTDEYDEFARFCLALRTPWLSSEMCGGT